MRGREEVVVVTGASAGVGCAVAKRSAQDGAAIALIARGREGVEGARRDVEAAGGRALVLPGERARRTSLQLQASELRGAIGEMIRSR
jgi:NADP-dependent 3-hydroxy acid dehydrogenase YdfG